MANIIQIQILANSNDKNPNTSTLIFPLMENFSMEVGSEMGTFADQLGQIADITNIASQFQVGISGKLSNAFADFGNMFNVPRWQKTNPIKINVKLPFFTIQDSKKDVVDPMKSLMNLTILTKGKDGSWLTPGLNATTIKATTKGGQDTLKITGGKLISVKIPGVVYLSVAMVIQATPTYSKQLTTKGFPLWGELDVQIISLYPATDDMFDMGLI